MKKPIAIISGEPNSISSEIIFKSWTLRKKNIYRPLIIIGSYNLLKLQKKKLKFKNIKIKKINYDFKIKDINKKELKIYNVNYDQKKAFQKITPKSKKYILNCFDEAIKLVKQKKIAGFINCPISKETLFKNSQQGVTEFLAKKTGSLGNEVMLIYNKKLSVAPLTTHIPISLVSNKITKRKIINKVKIINKFFLKYFNKKPKIGILGLNPHNYNPLKNSEEKKTIIPAIKFIKKMNIKALGPISPDASFSFLEKYKFDVILGMYHDQVLSPYKTLFKQDAINITLGLPFIRISPDHGVANDILGKKIANPKSLIESIKFFNHLK